MLLVCLVLGYAFYSTLYGSLGSLASRTEDAQAAESLKQLHALLMVVVLAVGGGDYRTGIDDDHAVLDSPPDQRPGTVKTLSGA